MCYLPYEFPIKYVWVHAENHSIVPTFEALERAKTLKLDLVEVNDFFFVFSHVKLNETFSFILKLLRNLLIDTCLIEI